MGNYFSSLNCLITGILYFSFLGDVNTGWNSRIIWWWWTHTCIGFGDASTRDSDVFPFLSEVSCLYSNYIHVWAFSWKRYIYNVLVGFCEHCWSRSTTLFTYYLQLTPLQQTAFWKHSDLRKKLLKTSNFSFCHNVFHFKS